MSEYPFGVFVAGRGAHVAFQVTTRVSSGAAAPKDISGSRWSYVLRRIAVGGTITAYSLTKGAAASTGWIDSYVALGASAVAAVEWEIVEIDDNNADAATASGKREVPLLRWRQAILAAGAA